MINLNDKEKEEQAIEKIRKYNELKRLQAEKNNLIFQIKKGVPNSIRKNHNKRIIQIQNEMANLNKLDDNEKNIHVIWIGISPKGEFDNLKLWAKYNPEYKIHIWTDSTHILSHKLNNIIAEFSKINNNENNYHLEANLKDDFYNEYQLKNPKKTFDENAKQFLIDKNYANEADILKWIKAAKEKLIQEQEDIKTYTTSEVILHDVNQEKDKIFSSSAYYDGYLKTLEHLHLCAGASDRLRCAIVNKLGGVYLDTDLVVQFNLEKIKNEQEITNLINSLEWDNIDDTFDRLSKKTEIVMNQMILLDILNKLDDENLKHFAKKWERVFKGRFDKNYEIFRDIAKKFKNMNLQLNPNMQLSDFPINNFFQVSCYERNSHNVYNAFIFGKENSRFLQEVMKKIEVTDEKIKAMDTYKKLINKDMMTLYHTGSANFYYTMMENDENYFYQHNKNCFKLASLDTINSFDSTWYSTIKHKDIIVNEDEIRFLFLDHTKDFKVLNYDDRSEIIKIKQQLKNPFLTKTEKVKIWDDDSFWFNENFKKPQIINKEKEAEFVLE